MKKFVEWAGHKWCITDEEATEEERREFIAETNRMLNELSESFRKHDIQR